MWWRSYYIVPIIFFSEETWKKNKDSSKEIAKQEDGKMLNKCISIYLLSCRPGGSLFLGLQIIDPTVQGAIRKKYPYWHGLGANRIKLAWRCRKQRLNVEAAEN